MIGDLSAWINIQSAITTIAGSLVVALVVWGLKRLTTWQEAHQPPNPITEETNDRLSGLLDAIERENKAAVAERDSLRADKAELLGRLQQVEEDARKAVAKAESSLVQMTLKYTQVEARVKLLEDAYTRDTGKIFPPP